MFVAFISTTAMVLFPPPNVMHPSPSFINGPQHSNTIVTLNKMWRTEPLTRQGRTGLRCKYMGCACYPPNMASRLW